MKNVRLRLRAGLLAAAVVVAGVAAPASAQGTGKSALDRAKQPEPGPKPTVVVPAWTKSALANGAQLIVEQKRGLPLVAVRVSFLGGRSQFEDPAKVGVANIAMQMLEEGTSTRSGDQISETQQLLGTEINTEIGQESGTVSFTALSSKLDAALDLVADMLVNSTYPAEALDRLRGQTLVALTQQRDQPRAIGANVFARTLYGDEHPYGRFATEQSVKPITRDDVVNFAKAYFRPARAIITVVGDVDANGVRASVERAFAAWPAGGEPATFNYPPVSAPRATTIYLVDKPKAAQSVFNLGLPGPSRDTPDYYSISVMNTVLGQLFQSRLNHLIREVKGYSYGVGSSFAFGRGPGAFRAGGDIVTAKTDSALIDFMNELKGVQGSKPFTEDEIQQGKESLIQSLVRRFESVGISASSISNLYLQGLPETYYRDFASNVNAVSPDDMTRVAKKYIDLDHLSLVIVGDRALIEEPLRKTGIAPVVLLDIDGKPIPVTP